MPPSVSEPPRSFRARRRLPTDARKRTRRLFARAASNVLCTQPPAPAPPPTPVQHDDGDLAPVHVGRRSFLARPPEQGATNKVLSVLRDSDKPAPAKPSATSHAHASSLAGSGYDEVDLSVKLEVDVLSVESKEEEEEEEVHLPTVQQDTVVEKDESTKSESSSGASAPRPNLVEVEASIVSDDFTSSNGRSRGGSSSRGPSSVPSAGIAVQDADDLLFIDDCPTANISFNFVGDEEDDVPEAPTSYTKQGWADLEDRVSVLQAEVEKVTAEKAAMEGALQEQNRELGVLLESMRLRAAESAAEVTELTRQLKDTKRRLNRRVKELEDEASANKLQYAEEVARCRAVETHLRAEIEVLRGSRFGRMEGSSASGTRRQRNVMQQALMRSRELDEAHGVVPQFTRTKSTGIASSGEPVRRKNSRHEAMGTKSWGPRRTVSPTFDTVVLSRGAARRSLLRRSLVAHIHSDKYKNARAAWHGFLEAEGGQVSPDQFARAVRGLAVASTAADRDLEVLRSEVCGAEVCDTGVVSWGMFAQFYEQTKNEST